MPLQLSISDKNSFSLFLFFADITLLFAVYPISIKFEENITEAQMI